MDFGHRDVAAIHFFLGGSFDRFGHVTVGDGAKQHVVAAGLLLDGEAADRVEGGAEGHGLLLEGGLALGLFGAAGFHLAQNGRCDGLGLACGEQEVTGVTRGDIDEVAVLAQAENVFVEDDLYALRHGLRGGTTSKGI